MKRLLYIAVSMAAFSGIISCGSEKKVKDRSAARKMFAEITSLTKSYTSRLENAGDSATWAKICTQYEDSLVKINFSYPPDTDLLLSEGQNDTIATLTRGYIKARDERINAILHPAMPTDTIDTIQIAKDTMP